MDWAEVVMNLSRGKFPPFEWIVEHAPEGLPAAIERRYRRSPNHEFLGSTASLVGDAAVWRLAVALLDATPETEHDEVRTRAMEAAHAGEEAFVQYARTAPELGQRFRFGLRGCDEPDSSADRGWRRTRRGQILGVLVDWAQVGAYSDAWSRAYNLAFAASPGQGTAQAIRRAVPPREVRAAVERILG